MSHAIGFHSAGLYRHPIETVVDKVARAGYDAVELNAEHLPWAKPHVTPQLSNERRKAIRNRVRDHGLMISSISAHVDLVDIDPEKQRANRQYAVGCIDLAGDMGIPIAHLLSGPPVAQEPCRETIKRLSETVARLIEHACRMDVKVAFEPVANHLICDSAGLLVLLEMLNPLQLFVNLDPSHLWVHGDDVPAAVNKLGSRIVHVHVKDAKGCPEDYQFPPLGQGDGDFKGFRNALKAIDYKGVLSVEYEANAFGYEESEQDIVEGSLHFVQRMIS